MKNTSDTIQPQSQNDPMLSIKEILRRLGIGRATLYRLIDAGLFPRPILISKGRVGVRESKVNRHMNFGILGGDK